MKLRKICNLDYQSCIAVEAASTPGLRFLENVFDMFRENAGDFLCVEADGMIVGLGKFTILYDGSGWVELLRVIPAYQKKGVGALLWQGFMQQYATNCEKGCEAIAMYTGRSNYGSKTLAERNGLKEKVGLTGANTENYETDGRDAGFAPVSPERAIALVLPHKAEWQVLNISHTFYDINEKSLAALAEEGMVFENPAGDFVVLGSRFEQTKNLFLAAYGGDFDTCICFARQQAALRQYKKLVAHFMEGDDAAAKRYEAAGFILEGTDIVLEKGR